MAVDRRTSSINACSAVTLVMLRSPPNLTAWMISRPACRAAAFFPAVVRPPWIRHCPYPAWSVWNPATWEQNSPVRTPFFVRAAPHRLVLICVDGGRLLLISVTSGDAAASFLPRKVFPPVRLPLVMRPGYHLSRTTFDSLARLCFD